MLKCYTFVFVFLHNYFLLFSLIFLLFSLVTFTLLPFTLQYLWNFTQISAGGFCIFLSVPRCEKCCLVCGYRCKGGAVHLKNQVTPRLMTASESLMCCSSLKIELNAHHIEAASKSLSALEKKDSKNIEAVYSSSRIMRNNTSGNAIFTLRGRVSVCARTYLLL